jgi:hypothetical protein
MQCGENETPDDDFEIEDSEIIPIEDRLNSLRSTRGSYSPQARKRIEYLQELRRLRAMVGDDAIDTF